MKSDDADVKELMARNLEGDVDAIPTLQQMFFDKHYSGLDIEALKNDDYVDAQRAILATDPVRGEAWGLHGGNPWAPS